MEFSFFGRKLEHLCNYSCRKISRFNHSCQSLFWLLFRFVLFHVNPFYIRLSYFLVVSLVGYLALRVSKPRTTSFRPTDFDVFFTSVSATTVSSMSTVEMEVFSNTQLIIMTVLMFTGGEVFISMLGLQLAKSKFPNSSQNTQNKSRAVVHIEHKPPIYHNSQSHIELGLVSCPQLETQKPDADLEPGIQCLDSDGITCNSIRCLGYVVLGYILIVNFVGSGLVALYVTLVPSASQVLKNKGLDTQTFSVFSTVSSFTNCGFIPTNESMMVFKKNSGLLLLLIPQVLLGNTFYPPCLFFIIWVLRKATKRAEYDYMLKNYRDMSYNHLLPGPRAARLAVTAFGFILIQFVLICSMEWSSEAMDGLNSYQKLVASLFQTINSRHAGESVFDLSIISPAVLVLFVVMMYLPPYTTFLGTKNHDQVAKKGEESQKRRKTLMECLMLSQLSYLVIFIILICITERHKMKEDPLNFNVLNITIEVISAYGNVGLSTGYSCKRQLKPDGSCKDAWYGFVGRWSTMGKLILIVVMFFGRLKNFKTKGGKA